MLTHLSTFQVAVKGTSDKALRNSRRALPLAPICPECNKDDFTHDANGRRQLGRHRFFDHGIRGSSPVARAKIRAHKPPTQQTNLQTPSVTVLENEIRPIPRVRVLPNEYMVNKIDVQPQTTPNPNTNADYYRAMDVATRTIVIKWYWATVEDEGSVLIDIGPLLCQCCNHVH